MLYCSTAVPLHCWVCKDDMASWQGVPIMEKAVELEKDMALPITVALSRSSDSAWQGHVLCKPLRRLRGGHILQGNSVYPLRQVSVGHQPHFFYRDVGDHTEEMAVRGRQAARSVEMTLYGDVRFAMNPRKRVGVGRRHPPPTYVGHTTSREPQEKHCSVPHFDCYEVCRRVIHANCL